MTDKETRTITADEQIDRRGGRGMIWFVLGFLAGSGVLLLFLGFLAVVTEDKERQEMARKQKERDKKNLHDLEDWYRNYY